MAIAGIVMGAISILLGLLYVLFLGAIISKAIECNSDPDAEGCEDFDTGAVQDGGLFSSHMWSLAKPWSPAPLAV